MSSRFGIGHELSIKGAIMYISILLSSLLFLVSGLIYFTLYFFNMFFLMKRVFLYQNKTFFKNSKNQDEIIFIESVFSGDYQPFDSLYILFKLSFYRSFQKRVDNKIHLKNQLFTVNKPGVKYE